MIPEEQARAKKIMIENRKAGMDVEDCAILAGVSKDTLYRWKKADLTFNTNFSQAWFEYKKSLIGNVKKKDAKFLLQTDFRERFTLPEEKKGNVNILIQTGGQMNEQQLRSRIAEIEGREADLKGDTSLKEV